MGRKLLIMALFLLALGAFSLYLRIHPIFVKSGQEVTTIGGTSYETKKVSTKNFLASLFCLIDLILVTCLFSCKNTAAYAFLLNGMLAILGTILMGHFTFAQLWGTGASLGDWLYLKSTLADIVILGADFLVGKVIYESYHPVI